MKTFRSVEEIKRFYLPETVEREREEEWRREATPQEIGERLAQESIEMLKKKLEKLKL